MTVPHLPENININSAKLPETYERAKIAITECSQVDECQDWADKAMALASYARQANDDMLYKMAKRIQTRAIRRCHELLKGYDGRGAHWANKSEGTLSSTLTKEEAAKAAGLSEWRQNTATRLGNIPEDEFERLVESDNPPTVTELAAMGTKSKPRPEGFAEATALLGSVKRFSEFCAKNEPDFVVGGVLPHEVSDLVEMVSGIDSWLDKFIVKLLEVQ